MVSTTSDLMRPTSGLDTAVEPQCIPGNSFQAESQPAWLTQRTASVALGLSLSLTTGTRLQPDPWASGGQADRPAASTAPYTAHPRHRNRISLAQACVIAERAVEEAEARRARFAEQEAARDAAWDEAD